MCFPDVGNVQVLFTHLESNQSLFSLGHKSQFIAESTQPFLANMVSSVDRVLQDLLVDREMLFDSMNLHMSILGHRTNQVINRLTMLSLIFLPLTFLCGVWGMNFQHTPELRWPATRAS